MKKNERYEVTINGYTSQGLGVARLPEGVVFVHQALSGERCEIQLLKVGAHESYARVVRVLEPSSQRIVPDCPVYGRCGGCALRHMQYEEECRMKAQRVQDALHRIGGIDLSVEILGATAQTSYRNKVIYPVAAQNNIPCRGYFRARTHTLIPVERCALVPEAADVLADVVIEWMRQYDISPYNEETLNGLVRNIYLRLASTGEIMVCLVVNGEAIPHARALIDALRSACPQLVSIVQCIHQTPGNAVLSDRFQTLWGTDTLSETLCGMQFRLSPRSFFQVNHDQAERLYAQAVKAAGLTGSETVLDLYCGTGTITLVMARHAREVIGVEVIPSAIEDAKSNAMINGITNARFLCADAGRAAAQLAAEGLTPDVIVVDPPRKGLRLDAIDAIAAMAPQRVVYVSCDPATLARDAQLLTRRGYEAISAQALDLFPRCAHVETVVLLSRGTYPQSIEVKIDVADGEVTEQPTYKRIQEYVEKKYGFKVHTAYIAEVKRMCGLDMHDAPNAVEHRKHEYHPCPPEKVEAIKDALRYYGMIP